MTPRILTSALALVGAGLIGGLTAPMLAGADQATPQQSVGDMLTLVDSARLLDTRTTVKPEAGTTVEIRVANGASAVAVNIKVTEADANGYVSAFPFGSARPDTSVLDYQAGDTVSNFAIVPVSQDGTFVLYTSASAHLVVDVIGRFGGTTIYVPEAPPVDPPVAP